MQDLQKRIFDENHKKECKKYNKKITLGDQHACKWIYFLVDESGENVGEVSYSYNMTFYKSYKNEKTYTTFTNFLKYGL